MPLGCSDQFTSPAKSSLNLRFIIRRYKTIQKILYGILITSRKLHHYFDAYNILMVSDFPLADVLHNRDATGRISKWAVELGALTLDFKPRTTIKSLALVYFMAEWQENQVEAPTNQPEHWVMYFDGSLKLGGGGAGVLFIIPRGEQLKYMFQILFEVSNKRLLVYCDSLLVVQQVNKEWDINKDTMDAYVMEIRKLEKSFQGWKFTTCFATTTWAVLSKLGSDRANIPPEFSFTSCITLPLGHQTQVPSLRVPRNPTERS
jgi:hypothetical protein